MKSMPSSWGPVGFLLHSHIPLLCSLLAYKMIRRRIPSLPLASGKRPFRPPSNQIFFFSQKDDCFVPSDRFYFRRL